MGTKYAVLTIGVGTGLWSRKSSRVSIGANGEGFHH